MVAGHRLCLKATWRRCGSMARWTQSWGAVLVFLSDGGEPVLHSTRRSSWHRGAPRHIHLHLLHQGAPRHRLRVQPTTPLEGARARHSNGGGSRGAPVLADRGSDGVAHCRSGRSSGGVVADGNSQGGAVNLDLLASSCTHAPKAEVTGTPTGCLAKLGSRKTAAPHVL